MLMALYILNGLRASPVSPSIMGGGRPVMLRAGLPVEGSNCTRGEKGGRVAMGDIGANVGVNSRALIFSLLSTLPGLPGLPGMVSFGM